MSGIVVETTPEHPSAEAGQAKTTNLARAAMFTALAVGSGYALLLIPNVELVTSIVFISGVYLGPRRGMTVGVVAEFIFSATNPLGSGLVFFPLLLAQVAGMGLVGFVGGILKRPLKSKNYGLGKSIFLGTTGALLTFVYDTVTTLSYPLTAGFEPKQTVAIWVAGIGFTLLHQASNAIIFFAALPRVFRRID